MRTGALVLAGLWAGSLCTVGYLVAPLLFARIEQRALAGDLAGYFFELQAWVSLALGVLLMLATWGRRSDYRRVAVIAAAIMGLQAFGEFVIGAILSEVRAAAGASSGTFAALHAVDAVLYLAASLLGLYLLIVVARGASGADAAARD